MAKKEYETSAVDTTRGSIMPEGIHRFLVTDIKEELGGSGFPYWAFTLILDEGSQWDGDMVWENISHSPKARFKMDEWLDAFAIPEGKKSHGEDFIGKHVRAKVIHGEYQGRKRAELDTYILDSGKKKKRGKMKPLPQKAKEVAADGSDIDTAKGLPEDSTPTKKGKKRAF